MRRMGWPVVLLGAALAACGGADSGGAGSNPVLSIGKTGIANGDNQIGTVASPLTNNLRVVVTDDGDPVEGEVITWAAGSGAVAPLQSTTDQNGVATTLWTLGTTAGLQNVTATLAGAVGSPLSFNAVANPGPVAGIAPTAGNGQFAVVSTAFAQSIGAKVSDQFGNGIIGVSVTWTVVSGPVTTTAGTSSSNSQGVATMTVNAAGTIGPAVVSAAAAGLLQTADFDLTVVPAARQVAVGNNFFQSGSNATTNPAVDTVVVGQRVQWSLGAGTHNVTSQGLPGFSSSISPMGASHTVQFLAPGTYLYACTFHGPTMSGTVVVQ